MAIINEKDKDLVKLRDDLAEGFRNAARDKKVKEAVRKRIHDRKKSAPLHKTSTKALAEAKKKEKARKKKKSVAEKISQNRSELQKVADELKKQRGG